MTDVKIKIYFTVDALLKTTRDAVLAMIFNNNMSISSSNTNKNCIKLRIVLLGDQGVGKSSIIDRYTTNRFE